MKALIGWVFIMLSPITCGAIGCVIIAHELFNIQGEALGWVVAGYTAIWCMLFTLFDGSKFQEALF